MFLTDTVNRLVVTEGTGQGWEGDQIRSDGGDGHGVMSPRCSTEDACRIVHLGPL